MARSTETGLLTIAELARNLELPESTTRYYCNRFAAHLPSVGEGRRRRYKPEAFEKLKTIAFTMRRDKNAYAVDLALRNEETVPTRSMLATGSSEATDKMLAHMESQARALQDIASTLNSLADRLSGENPVPAPRPQANGDLRQEIAAIREQIRTSETMHQNDLEQLRKWIARLGAVANK